MSFRIVFLADHPEVMGALAAALEREWPDWYGQDRDALADLENRSRTSGLPLGLVALEADSAIGTLAIADRATPSHQHLTPWIVGFWVEAARRKRGIGAKLLKAACAQAWTVGYERLYVSTATASRLFLREGWHKIDIGTTHGGARVEIFSMKLT